MKKGSIVLVEFTGRDTVTGTIFDTTDEKTAKEVGIYREAAIFRPVPVIVGKGDLIKGLEEELEKMNSGEEKTVSIPPEKAFGERKRELVVIVPLREFKARKILPFPGLVVEINSRYGKVQTVSGGRVRVDFNLDLAGKTVEYKLKVVKELKNRKEQVDALLWKYFPLKEGKAEANIKAGEVEVLLPTKLPKEIQILKDEFAKTITENVKGIKKVRFVEEFEKEKASEEKEAKEEEKAGEKEASENKEKEGANAEGQKEEIKKGESNAGKEEKKVD